MVTHKKPTWWKVGVIYQVYPRSFQDTNEDGVGDLSGIVSRLDYLEWLGIDAIWISPFYPSPMEDFGYDITDYTGLDPVFGELPDFDALVAEAHRRSIRVILDFVPNHTSHLHPWFVESRSARESEKRNWYIWQDPKPDGSPPNNWRGQADPDTEGSAWAFDEFTGQYYLANFSPSQPELNWRNTEVREAMMDAMRFWLDRDADGFRVDMVDFLGKDPDFRDESPLAEGKTPRDYLVEARYQLNRPETLDYIREMKRILDQYPDRVLIGEVIYFLPVERMAAYYGEGDLLDLPTNFRFTFLPPEAPVLRRFVDDYDAALREHGAWPNHCLGNHDSPRVSRHGEETSRLLAMMLLTLRGTPFVYYGDEIGMPNVKVLPDKRQDGWDYIGRDPARTPMQWDASPNAGFCHEHAEPWLPVSDEFEKDNVESQRSDSRSMLALYRRLLGLRRAEQALSLGDYEAMEDAPERCFAYRRQYEGRRLLVALNFSGEAIRLTLAGCTDAKILLSTYLNRDGETGAETLELRPFEGIVAEVPDMNPNETEV